ncbi:MAG: peptidoglycan DD-metalloendopeptidase family protein [Chloroflexi bacterium]|nr:peptidoglycan DD-metalloendopeptidase family protein [Chloroflexota bacterium]
MDQVVIIVIGVWIASGALLGGIVTPIINRHAHRSEAHNTARGIWTAILAGAAGNLLFLVPMWRHAARSGTRPPDGIESSRHLEGFLILAVLAAIAGLFFWQNNTPSTTVALPQPTNRVEPTASPNLVANLPTAEVALDESSPVPAAAGQSFSTPTYPPPSSGGATSVPASEMRFPTRTPINSPTPTPTENASDANANPNPNPTPFPSPTGISAPRANSTLDYEPPPANVPLSLHINDHYWFKRPVDVSANSEEIFYYTFGSNGLRDDMRVHHGVDMPNDIGVPVHAAYAGEVIFAGLGAEAIGNTIDIYPSYGNVVVIKHRDGFRGQDIWTLYAHMQALNVVEGQLIEAGDILGVSGGTGDVSGPHVHMEVRVGENDYWATYNPLLWIVPQTGKGVVAGQVLSANGTYIDDVIVTLTNNNGGVTETTTTYVDPYTPDSTFWHVRPDPFWQENFVMADIPAGNYTVSVTIGGLTYRETLIVRAGTTNFVVLGEEQAATPQPVITPAS